MGRAFEFRKERKMKRWSKMAKVFSRLGKDIVIAIKEGGTEVDTNAKLRAVIQNCKAANMPKDIVDRAIKKATDKDTADYKEVTFEGYAPHGIAILVETATDNNQRTVADVRSYFNKCNGNLATSGSVSFMFDRKCHFTIPKGEIDLEEFEFEMIDHGLDEVFENDEQAENEAGEQVDTLMIYGAFVDFGKIQSALEEKSIEILASGFEQIPQQTKELNEEETKDVEKLLDKLEDNDDVQYVYHNMT